MKVGTVVRVFGKKLATVVSVSSNGKRVLLTGDHNGWTNCSNVKAVAA